MDEDRDMQRTAVAVVCFIFGCSVYLAVAVPAVARLWDPVVATIGTEPIAFVLGLGAVIAGAISIRYVIQLVNRSESA